MEIYYYGCKLSTTTGIYKITFCTKFGKFTYFGKTETNFSKRWSNHRCSFNNQTCNRRIRKILEITTKITFEVVEVCEPKYCKVFEDYYIKKYQPELNIQLKK